jgi:hypothetical protein
MSRESLQIKAFNAGIITNVDEKDIPLDAATDSTDVDNNAPEGILRGRREEYVLETPYHAKQAVMVQRADGKHDLVYNDVLNGVLGYQLDFYGAGGGDAPTLSPVDLSGAADTTLVSMTQHNGVVRIGKGGTAANPPKWVGRIDDTTFRGKYENEYVITDAELTNLAGIPSWYKVILFPTYFLGVARYGDRIYKVDTATGAVEVSPVEHRFNKIDAFCVEQGAGAVWVGETIGNDFRLSRVSPTTLEVNAIRTVSQIYSGERTPEEYRVSDILHSSTPGLMYLAQTPQTTGKTMKVYTIPFSTTSGVVTPTDRSRNIDTKQPSLTPGGFAHPTGGLLGDVAQQPIVRELLPICLSDLTGDKVGVSASMEGLLEPWPKQPLRYRQPGGYYPSNIYDLMFVIDPNEFDTTNLWGIVVKDTMTYGSPHGFLATRYNSVENLWYSYSSDRGIRRWKWSTHPTVNGGLVTATYTTGDEIATGDAYMAYIDQSNFVTVNGPSAYYDTHVDFGVGENNLTALREGNGVEIAISDIATVIFDDPRDVYYGIALEYDSFQISPIYTGFSTRQDKKVAQRLTLTINYVDLINPRVNAIILYRAFGASNSAGPEEFYRRWARIEASDPRWNKSVAGEVSLVIDDDYSETGPSYEAATGIPESMEKTMVNYGLASIVAGYQVVGGCYHPDIPDASRMLFRSKAQRFDMYNWADDFVALPSPPLALAQHAGRLWVFDRTRAYRVNVEGMFVEDVLEGCGTWDMRGVVEAPEGVYVANENGLYLVSGQGRMEVSYPIRDLWRDGVSNAVLAMDETTDSIYVFSTTGGVTLMYVFHRTRHRWDIWNLNDAVDTYFEGVFNGRSGEVYYTANDGTSSYQLRVADGTTWKAWNWVSRKFEFGQQIFKVYSILLDGAATTYIDTDSVTSHEIFDHNIPEDYRSTKNFRFTLEGTGNVRGVTLLLRRMVGLR